VWISKCITMNTCITDIHIRYIIFLFSVFAKRKVKGSRYLRTHKSLCYYFIFQQKGRFKGSNKLMSDTELIHDEIDREVATCSCRNPLRVEMVDEGKYRVCNFFYKKIDK